MTRLNMRTVVLSALIATGLYVGSGVTAPVQATTPEADEPIETTVQEEIDAAQAVGTVSDYSGDVSLAGGKQAGEGEDTPIDGNGKAARKSSIDIFPIQQNARFTDTFGASRGGGTRRHLGVDVMSKQMNETYAAVSGTIRKVKNEGVHEGKYASSFYLLLDGDDGRSYFYVHLNNDTPGRPKGCDGKGGMENALSPRLVEYYNQHKTLQGARVERGEHIGYVGSSGNASCGVDHIHLEIWPAHGWDAQKRALNPYPILKAAYDTHGAPYGNNGIGNNSPKPSEPSKPEAGNKPTAEKPAAEKPAAEKPSSNSPLEGAERISSSERIGTAARLSASSFKTATTAVVVPADTYQGALLGAPLAAAHNGPVLLSETGRLSEATQKELKRLGVRNVYTVGTMPGASSGLTKAGFKVTTVDHKDPAVLANKVAELVAQSNEGKSELSAIENRHVILVSGDKNAWPDALAGSVLAATDKAPVLFTDRDTISDQTLETIKDLNPSHISVIGGTARVSDKVFKKLQSQFMLVDRLSGPGRVETALAVSSYMVSKNPSITNRVFVATSSNYPDALAAGPALAAQGGVLVLANPSGSNSAVREWISSQNGVDNLYVIGGTSVMPNATVNAIAKSAR
ncbi:cell wall-binding repeat-containing protein [Stomatohabitans albus]|uniref:cell wall-binding repeat-containing protein n=1 Tax=Stomatohabitans albus TaxID=3110766 RepID=UPI00300CF82F